MERDIPQLGFRIAAPTMMRLLSMLAFEHGSILNQAKLASAMGLSAPTIRHYIDIMEQTYIVRTLQPFFCSKGKRLVKTPRVYVRDSGLLHQLLGIPDFIALFSHSVFGHSWEGLVVENVCSSSEKASFSFYRTSDVSEEMDLVVEFADRMVAIECKASQSPQLTQGFWKALDTLKPSQAYVVVPADENYPLRENVEVIGLPRLLERLGASAS